MASRSVSCPCVVCKGLSIPSTKVRNTHLKICNNSLSSNDQVEYVAEEEQAQVIEDEEFGEDGDQDQELSLMTEEHESQEEVRNTFIYCI